MLTIEKGQRYKLTLIDKDSIKSNILGFESEGQAIEYAKTRAVPYEVDVKLDLINDYYSTLTDPESCGLERIYDYNSITDEHIIHSEATS